MKKLLPILLLLGLILILNKPEKSASSRPSHSRAPSFIALADEQSLEKIKSENLKEMRLRPDLFRKSALSLDEYEALPEAHKPYIARPFSAVGEIRAQWETSLSPKGKLLCLHQNSFVTDGKSLELINTHGSKHLPANQQIISGHILGDQLLIDEDPVRRISPEEIEVAKSSYPIGNPDGMDPLNGQVANQNYALVGGKLFSFSHPEMITYLSEALRSENPPSYPWILGDTGGVLQEGDEGNTPYQVNEIDVLYIRIDFPDMQGEPISKTDLETILTTVDGHLDDFSYAQAGITATVSDQVYRMPSDAETYALAGDITSIQTDARLLASANYTLTNYDVIAVYFTNLSAIENSLITFAGRASIGANPDIASHWINGSTNSQVILHEFGHNFGLFHANYYHPEQELSGSYTFNSILEYGDIFDIMGDGDAPAAQFNPIQLNQLDWLPDNKVLEVSSNGTWTIHRFDGTSSLSNAILALKVPMQGGVNYWVGFRQRYTTPTYNLANAAYVVAENKGQARESTLIDMTPESQPGEYDDREDAGLPIGGSHYDAQAGVTFEALSKGGSVGNEWIEVRIQFEPRISIRDALIEIDEQAGTAQVVLARTFNSAGEVSVDFSTADDSAVSPADYYTVSGTVSWADGDDSDKTVIIPIRPDLIIEGTESFSLSLANPVGGILETAASSTDIHILDPGQAYTGFMPPHFNNTINSIVPLDNGQVIMGGNIYEGIGDYEDIRHIARLNPDGSVDSSFVSGTGFNAPVNMIVRQDDGKLLVGGEFTTYNGTTCNRLVRLLANGAIDNSFLTQMGTGANGSVACIAIENDGGILVGGEFSNFNTSSVESLVRLNADGSVNTLNALNLPFTNGYQTRIYAMFTESDGKIMVGGSFYINSQNSIARLETDGTLDSSFNAGTGFKLGVNTTGNVYTVQQLKNGDYLVGGNFITFNNNAVTNIARILNNGSYDPSFTSPAFDDVIHVTLPQANGQYIIGGRFTSPASRLERLQTTGTSDSQFQQGTGTSWYVNALESTLNGQVYVAGNFFTYNGNTVRPIFKIAGGVSPYELWVAENFTQTQIDNGLADPDADPDADLIQNLAELAMGTDPNLNNPASSFAVDSQIDLVDISGQSYLQISLSKTDNPDGPWYSAQFSGDLNTWAPVTPHPTSSDFVIIENSATRYTVRDSIPITPASPRFGRIILQSAE